MRDLLQIYERKRRQPLLYLCLLPLQKRLTFLGRLVFRVLPQVAVLSGAENLFGQVHPELALDLIQLVLQFLANINQGSVLEFNNTITCCDCLWNAQVCLRLLREACSAQFSQRENCPSSP